jgi:hypothetical protein
MHGTILTQVMGLSPSAQISRTFVGPTCHQVVSSLVWLGLAASGFRTTAVLWAVSRNRAYVGMESKDKWPSRVLAANSSCPDYLHPVILILVQLSPCEWGQVADGPPLRRQYLILEAILFLQTGPPDGIFIQYVRFFGRYLQVVECMQLQGGLVAISFTWVQPQP